jgi:hypothetical protein
MLSDGVEPPAPFELDDPAAEVGAGEPLILRGLALERDEEGADVAEMTRVEKPPRGREEVPVQVSRLLEAHESILRSAHELAKLAEDSGDHGTNDLVVSEVIRCNELQVWFVSEHLVDTPLVRANDAK